LPNKIDYSADQIGSRMYKAFRVPKNMKNAGNVNVNAYLSTKISMRKPKTYDHAEFASNATFKNNNNKNRLI